MIWFWIVVSEQGRKKPHAVVVHYPPNEPKWSEVSKNIETVLRELFQREKVFANVPAGDGTYSRVEKTWQDADYLEVALNKVNLPLYIVRRGQWDCNYYDSEPVIKYLKERFLGDED